jgi:hypothetical protein
LMYCTKMTENLATGNFLKKCLFDIVYRRLHDIKIITIHEIKISHLGSGHL